jgi:hypothetical protein
VNPYLIALWITAAGLAVVSVLLLALRSDEGNVAAGWAFGTAVLVAIAALVVGAIRWRKPDRAD